MHVRVVAVGKVREPYVAQACAEFLKRQRAYYPIDVVEVRASDGAQPHAAMREEGERILRSVGKDDRMWLLDREGRELASEELAREIASVSNAGCRRLTFVVGGAYGVCASVRDRADFVWSLSRLTFLHEWARMLVLEQLYRAAKIARNEPYHH